MTVRRDCDDNSTALEQSMLGVLPRLVLRTVPHICYLQLTWHGCRCVQALILV
jgi:hypothetical protein